jgi:leucyl-tRNA---protein transferase
VKQASELNRLLFYATPAHECSYLDGRIATTVFADPNHPKDMGLYTALSQVGFRRSGQHIYRPQCQICEQCIPVRVSAARFRPRRSQRRVWRMNLDLVSSSTREPFSDERFALYCRYIDQRHRGGGMDNPTPQQYLDFLTSDWAQTTFYEFRLLDRLVAVAVLDRLGDGLSSVYSFFDPDFSHRSPGVFSILWALYEARRLGLPWLYLGYWIEGSAKMSYKCEYQPQQRYRDGRWETVR